MKYKYLILILLLGFLSFKGIAQQVAKDTTIISTYESVSFNPEAAKEQYLNTITDEQKEKSDAYFEGGYWLRLWNFLLGLVVAWIFLSFGLSRWIKNRAEKVRNIHFQNFIYLLFYFLFSYLLVFPLNIYQGFFREHSYGLSNLSFGGWLTEEMKGLALALIFGSIFITFLYWVIGKVKQSLWIWGSFIMVLFLVFSITFSETDRIFLNRAFSLIR